MLMPFLAVLSASAMAPQIAAEPPITTVVAADARFTSIRDSLIAKVRAGRMPSIAITATENGRTVWEEAIGWGDRERGIAASPAMSYALGSLSKSLTSTALLALVERGIVDLDAPLEEWVRLAAPTGVRTQPTLRQLLDASGGVPHGWRSMPQSDVPRTRAAWDDWLAHNAFLAFAPGAVFEYSNNSFGVAARVAERATGVPFAEVIRRYLFAPLGMRASGAVVDTTGAMARRYSSRGTPLPWGAAVPEAGLGLFASAADLARLGNFIRGHVPDGGTAPISPGFLAMVWQPAVGPSRDFFHFGFWNGGRVLVTNGNISGANAHLAIGRDADVVVAVTVNRTGNDADEAIGPIMDALLPPAPDGPDMRATYEALYRRPWSGTPALLGRWSGSLILERTRAPLALDVRADTVFVRFGAGPWRPLGSPRMSAFGELHAGLTTEVPGLTLPASGPTRLDFTLKWEGDVLRGYVLPRGDVAQPAAVRLVRGARAGGRTP